jgi:glucosylceramidase
MLKINLTPTFLKLVYLVLLTFCSNLCFAISQELILNGGFEESSGGKPNSWSSRGNGGWAVWKTGENWGQTAQCFVCCGGYSGSEYQEWVQTIDVAPGTTCTISADSCTESWGTPTGYIRIDWKDLSGNTIDTYTNTIFFGICNTTWSRYSSSNITIPANAVTAEIILHGGISGTILFDQVSFNGKLPPKQINADFNGDLFVDLQDFAILANAWLQSSTTYDLTNDNYVTSGDVKTLAEHWLKAPDLLFEGNLIEINDKQKYQEIDGFGASMTDSSAYLIGNLNSDRRVSVLEDLFDPNIGIGLTYLRQPMGASDFRRVDYSYDDIPDSLMDYNLNYFSINYDTTYIIPLIQEALGISPEIKIMGTPWSPPKWMKTSKQFGYGSLINDDRVYRALANYFVKYIQAYASWGIDIDAVTLQNEPYYEPYSYPGMHMEPADQIRLIKFMGPFFEANDIDTKILVWDHNWDRPEFPTAVLNDSQVNQYTAGTAWHWYGGDISAQSQVHDAYPDKDTYFTEGSDGTWQSQDFGWGLIDNGNLIVRATRNWAKTVVKWNLALDQNNGPKTSGGCDTCHGVITIDSITHAVSHRPQYYALGHASKFVRPGAVRIQSTESAGSGIENVVFQNRDNSIVCLVTNASASSHNLKIAWNNKSFIYPLPAVSFSTFVWRADSNDVNVWITTGDQQKLLQKQRMVFFE